LLCGLCATELQPELTFCTLLSFRVCLLYLQPLFVELNVHLLFLASPDPLR